MDETTGNGGLSGLLKGVAMLAVLVLAGLSLMLVFEVISREVFAAYLGKSALAVLIVVLASLAIGLIARGGRRA